MKELDEITRLRVKIREAEIRRIEAEIETIKISIVIGLISLVGILTGLWYLTQ